MESSQFIIMYLWVFVVFGSSGKIYERCDLANLMVEQHRFPKGDIANCKGTHVLMLIFQLIL